MAAGVREEQKQQSAELEGAMAILVMAAGSKEQEWITSSNNG